MILWPLGMVTLIGNLNIEVIRAPSFLMALSSLLVVVVGSTTVWGHPWIPLDTRDVVRGALGHQGNQSMTQGEKPPSLVVVVDITDMQT